MKSLQITRLVIKSACSLSQAVRKLIVGTGAEVFNLRDKTAIVGIGESEYSRNARESLLRLQLQAATRAIEDSGLSIQDIDGIIPGFMGPTVEDFVTNFGLRDLRYTVTVRMGGASAVASLQSAAMAITSGVSRQCFASPAGGAVPREVLLL